MVTSKPALKSNGKKHVTQQSVDAAIWSVCDIMRRGNVASALQYVPELTWIPFLRILDETEDREEQEADAVGASYNSSLRRPFRWKDWAAPRESDEAKPNKRKELEDAGSKAFMAFVNGEAHLPDQRTVYDDVIDEFAALRTQIARIGTNVNQIARRLNSDGDPHPVDTAVLKRAERLLSTAQDAVKAVDEAAFRAAGQKAGRA